MITKNARQIGVVLEHVVAPRTANARSKRPFVFMKVEVTLEVASATPATLPTMKTVLMGMDTMQTNVARLVTAKLPMISVVAPRPATAQGRRIFAHLMLDATPPVLPMTRFVALPIVKPPQTLGALPTVARGHTLLAHAYAAMTATAQRRRIFAHLLMPDATPPVLPMARSVALPVMKPPQTLGALPTVARGHTLLAHAYAARTATALGRQIFAHLLMTDATPPA